MKKSFFILFSLFLLTSCNFKENLKKKFDEVEEMKSDLANHFNHDSIDLSLGWGTEESSNYALITFYDFDVESKKFSELKDLAYSIIFRFTAKNPKMENKAYIEVRFTPEKEGSEKLSYTSFTIRYNDEEKEEY